MELLLKARLMREHWALVCTDVSKAIPASFEAGDVNTLPPKDLLGRLATIAAVQVTDKHRQQLGELLKQRHRAVHFALVHADPTALKTTLAQGLNFILWLLESEFRHNGTAEEQDLVEDAIDELTTELGLIASLVKERMKSIENVLADAALVLECPRCRQNAFLVGDDDPSVRCAYCLWRPDGETCAHEYVENVLNVSYYEALKRGGIYPVYSCPSCSAEAMVSGVVPQGGHEADAPETLDPHSPWWPPSWSCFSCGSRLSKLEMELCEGCGEAVGDVADDDGRPLCQNCLEDAWARF